MKNQIIIAGCGMVSPLGYDVLTSCAAARAGLVRSHVLDNFRIRSAVEGREEPVLGHSVRLLTSGYERNARLCRLMQGALKDLIEQNPDCPWQGKSHRFYLALPSPFRTRNEEASKATSSKPVSTEDNVPMLEKTVMQAIELSKWSGEVALGCISAGDSIAAMHAIEAAIADLLSGAVTFAIVLGADSLLDEDTLIWLHQSGRLKCDAAPSGLQPGEAGVSMLLTLEDQTRNSRPRITVTRPSINQNGSALNSGQPPNGEGLAEAIAAAVKASQHQLNRAWIVADQNGEFRTANEWGHALARLRAIDQAYADPAFWYPIASFGDSGAAGPLLGICMAWRAFERHYAVSDTAIITATSAGKERGAVSLTTH